MFYLGKKQDNYVINFFKYIIVSFKVILINSKKNCIEFDDLFDFFYNSWLYGFRFIFLYINNNNKLKSDIENAGYIFPNNIQILENLVYQNKDKIKAYILANLKSLDIDISKGMDIEQFKKWLSINHDLEITYLTIRIVFAMNLNCLDEICMS